MGLFQTLYEAAANDSNNQTLAAEKQIQSIQARLDKVKQDIKRAKDTNKDTKQLEMQEINLYNQLAKAEIAKNNYKNRALQQSILNNNKELADVRASKPVSQNTQNQQTNTAQQ